MDKSRDESFDLLRAISCVAIVFLHVSGWTFGVYGYKNTVDANFFGATFFNVLTRFAVPVFIMMTGAFTLSNPKNKNWKYFYKKVWKTTVLPTLIFSALYVIYVTAVKVLQSGFSSFASAISSSLKLWLVGDPFGHMWYMYMLIGFYVFAPFLCRIVQRLSISQRWIIGIIFMILGCVWMNMFGEPIWPLKFAQYLGYFVLGDAIYQTFNDRKSSKVFEVGLFISIVIATVGLIITYAAVYTQVSGWKILWKINYHERLGPTVVISSVALFMAFANARFRCNKHLSNIAKNSFFIYLVHGGVVSVTGNLWDIIIDKPFGSPWIVVPIYALIALLISYLIAVPVQKFYMRVTQKGVRS